MTSATAQDLAKAIEILNQMGFTVDEIAKAHESFQKHLEHKEKTKGGKNA